MFYRGDALAEFEVDNAGSSAGAAYRPAAAANRTRYFVVFSSAELLISYSQYSSGSD